MPELTGSLLLERARTGDRAALEQLLTRHQTQIYRFGLKVCRDHEDAADVVQEVAASLAGKVDSTRLEALREAIGEFDFEGARTKLMQIAADCHLSVG